MPCLAAITVVLLVAWQVIYGILQLFGVCPSHHDLFPITGSMGNPGPYAGFLAIGLPLTIAIMWRWSASEHMALRGLSYLSRGVALLSCFVLPATQSRTAWLAVIVAVGWLASRRYNWKWKMHASLRCCPRRFWTLATCAILLVTLTIAVCIWIKPMSAAGRILYWRMAVLTIARNPWYGFGKGHYPAAYAETQEAYFADGNYAPWEELVSATPDESFCEYLRLGMEYGVGAIVVMIALIGGAIYLAYHHRREGTMTSLIAFAIFAMASYPLQDKLTIILLLLLCLLAFAPSQRCSWKIVFGVTICGCGLFHQYECTMRRAANFAYYADEIWGVAHHFYQLKSYSQAKELYSQIYNRHTEHPRFLFEYAHTLHYLGEYDDSNKLLEAASTWSGDPMIWNVMGKNYQALGNYPEAERCYFRALHRVPSRIYPYYLLAKLYALPDYYHPISFRYYCNQVLNKDAKINSLAIEEMRSEIKSFKETIQ